jgi:hypothetical protein
MLGKKDKEKAAVPEHKRLMDASGLLSRVATLREVHGKLTEIKDDGARVKFQIEHSERGADTKTETTYGRNWNLKYYMPGILRGLTDEIHELEQRLLALGVSKDYKGPARWPEEGDR